MKTLYYLPVLFLLWNACNIDESQENARLDPDMHTYSNYQEVSCRHLDWSARVDFEKKRIHGIATWTFQNPKQQKWLHLDTYDLGIGKVTVNGKPVIFKQGKFDTIYGVPLSIPIQNGDSVVSIEYITGPTSIALQWLNPEQTAGKKLPYLFTQCESIFARSLLPCQDVPAQRITYNANVQVPKGMMAVMSAKNPVEKNPEGRYRFEMEIPIPVYLIALAVGDIEYKAIDERCGVYTEPVMLASATGELSDIPKMMDAAEALGGPYQWGHYDVLIAPPSFPIGGMENPRLTFATPTILAGDKSLVSLIAHEMAHSWSGNLVTNATWNDLWLNEGFTTYFERRIMEAVSGKDYNDMLWELGFQDLQSDLRDLGDTSQDTRLRVELKHRHPGDGFTNIPYEKGAIFLKMLEENLGRALFDTFLNKYFQQHKFQPMTTEKCLEFMDKHLFAKVPDSRARLKVDAWVYQPGLPDNCPKIQPLRFLAVDQARTRFQAGGSVQEIPWKTWTTHEQLHFLRKLPRPLDSLSMSRLDQSFKLTETKNAEVADEWFKLSIASGYTAAYPSMKAFLSGVGRKKFLEPLYLELLKTPEGKKLAIAYFNDAKQNYHPLTAVKIAGMLKN